MAASCAAYTSSAAARPPSRWSCAPSPAPCASLMPSTTSTASPTIAGWQRPRRRPKPPDRVTLGKQVEALMFVRSLVLTLAVCTLILLIGPGSSGRARAQYPDDGSGQVEQPPPDP